MSNSEKMSENPSESEVAALTLEEVVGPVEVPEDEDEQVALLEDLTKKLKSQKMSKEDYGKLYKELIGKFPSDAIEKRRALKTKSVSPAPEEPKPKRGRTPPAAEEEEEEEEAPKPKPKRARTRSPPVEAPKPKRARIRTPPAVEEEEEEEEEEEAPKSKRKRSPAGVFSLSKSRSPAPAPPVEDATLEMLGRMFAQNYMSHAVRQDGRGRTHIDIKSLKAEAINFVRNVKEHCSTQIKFFDKMCDWLIEVNWEAKSGTTKTGRSTGRTATYVYDGTWADFMASLGE